MARTLRSGRRGRPFKSDHPDYRDYVLKKIFWMKKGNNKKDIADNDIVEMVIKDPNSYKYIIERYEKKLLGYIRRILFVSKEDAEDILQDVFIKAYKNINSYDSKYSFSSWIYRIAHNESVSFLRKKKKIIECNQDD